MSLLQRRPRRAAAALVGKLSRPELERQVLGPLQRGGRRGLVVPPSPGVDVGVVRAGQGQVLVLTTDPVYVEPALGWEDAAWFAFHILASDLTTSGVAPRWIALDLNWPPEADRRALPTFMRVWSQEARGLGAVVATGHTGRYEGCHFPIVGASTFGAWAPERGYVTSALARPGDRLLLSKGGGLESAVLLAALFPRRVRAAVGGSRWRELLAMRRSLSTVEEALLAARVGLRDQGVWAMHDATEGGVRQALEELARASGCGAEVDLTEAIVPSFVAEMARLFGFDPMASSSEGSLLVACAPGAVDRLLASWRQRGIAGSEVGHLTAHRGRVRDRGVALPPAPADGFWPAVVRARRRRWA